MAGQRAKAFIIGVNHRIQYTKTNYKLEWKNEICSFSDYLAEKATLLNVDLIAEEFNDEAIHKNDASTCTVRDTAKRISRKHLFLDPDSRERPASFTSKEEKMEYREDEWLRRIKIIDSSVFIIVCGDAHVDSFAAKLDKAGYDVEILSRNQWGIKLDSEITSHEALS